MSKEDLYIHALVKIFTHQEHAEAFRRGQLLTRPLWYFRQQEHKERGDSSEGITKLLQPAQSEITIMGQRVDPADIVGPLVVEHEGDSYIPAVCLWSCNAAGVRRHLEEGAPLVDPRMGEFGQHCVFVTNVGEFVERVKRAAQAKEMDARGKHVTYVDMAAHHGEVGPWRKDLSYAHQSEFRIAMPNCRVREGDDRFPFEVGSLEDITVLGPTSQFLTESRIVPKGRAPA